MLTLLPFGIICISTTRGTLTSDGSAKSAAEVKNRNPPATKRIQASKAEGNNGSLRPARPTENFGPTWKRLQNKFSSKALSLVNPKLYLLFPGPGPV